MTRTGLCWLTCDLHILGEPGKVSCCLIHWKKRLARFQPQPGDTPAVIPELEAIGLFRFNKGTRLKWRRLEPSQVIFDRDYSAEIEVWDILPDGREKLSESIYLSTLPKDERQAREIFEAIQKIRIPPKAAGKQSEEKRRHGEAAAVQQRAAMMKLLGQQFPGAKLAQTAYDLVAVAPGLAPANWEGSKSFIRNASLVKKLAGHYERIAVEKKNPQKTQAQLLLARHWLRDGLFNLTDKELAAFIGGRMTPQRTLKPNTVAKYARELGLLRVKSTGPRPRA